MAAGDYAPTGHGLLLGQTLRPAVSAFNVMLACLYYFIWHAQIFVHLFTRYAANVQQFTEKALRVSQFFWPSRGKSANDGKLGKTEEQLFLSGIVKADTRLGIQSASFHLQHCTLSETFVCNACSGLQVAGKGRCRTL